MEPTPTIETPEAIGRVLPGWTASDELSAPAAEDPRLLLLELLLGEHAPVAEIREPLELGRHRRRSRRRPRAARVLRAVLLPELVDRLLHELGVADVGEDLLPARARRLDHEVARADDALEHPLVEPHVVDRLERDLHRALGD